MSNATSEKVPQKKKHKLLRWLMGTLLGLVLLVVVVWVFFLPTIVTRVVKQRSGFDMQISHMSVNPFTAKVSVDGLVINNPAPFLSPEFVDMRSFYVKAQLFSLFSDQIIVDEARLDLGQVALVRPAEGLSNAQLFAERMSGGATPSTAPSGKPAPTESKPLNFLIKKLDVKFDKLVVITEAEGKPTRREFNFNYKYTYENVTSPSQLLTIELGKSLLSVGSQMSGMIPGAFGKTVDSVFQGGLNFLNAPADSVKGLFDKLDSMKKP